MIKQPIVSVIMPVYNVELYLAEAIDSVINQTIGFKENVELILINDGSRDSSGKICSRYAEVYPDNILYIEQKNQGLSATRYNGFIKARGEYIHSLDSDDTISANYYEEAVYFFNQHKDEVDIVASKLMLFEARMGDHYLNHRFKTSRVIKIDDETDAFQYHIASCVIRRNAVKEEWFDKNISIAEDARLIAIILKEKRAYGVVSDTVYNYRIRDAGGSLINTQHEKRDFYLETPKRFWQYILDYWTEDDGTIAPFIQKFILNDIQWRLNEQKSQKVLTPSEEKEYKDLVYSITSRIDDEIILSQDRLNVDRKIFLLKKKYGDSFQEHLSYKDGKYKVNDNEIVNLHHDTFGLVLDFLTPTSSGTYKIEGYPTNDRISSRDKVYISTSKGKYELEYRDRVQRRKDSFLGDVFHDEEAFEATIQVGDEDRITGLLRTFNGIEVELPLFTKRHTKLSTLNHSYRIINTSILKKVNHKIYIKPYTKVLHAKYEVIFWTKILKNLRVRDTARLLKDGVEQYRYFRLGYPVGFKNMVIGLCTPFGFLLRNTLLNISSILLRIAYYITKIGGTKKPIWIISDRGIGAGDNGEAFFSYLATLKDTNINYYFAISRKSPDYSRMKDIGPVIDMDSLRYKALFLRASKIISSQADEYIINPFGMREPQMVDILAFDFIFLQHGVTKNDISDWLNRFFKNIKLFVTVAKREHDSILEYPFYYKPENVLLSGFPRYDKLVSEPKRKIILAPTWRKYLTSDKVGSDGGWEYQHSFKDSDYFRFYSNIMNDQRIIAAMKAANIQGEFYLHPSHAAQIKDFSSNDMFKVMDFPYNYTTAFKEGNLLITDYSSVYFDFSYLNKPVIYTQFDKEHYYANHGVYTQGYFDEERDGFGPVCKDYESSVEQILRSITSQFSVEGKYQKRIDEFFKYNDKANSQRVYESILNV